MGSPLVGDVVVVPFPFSDLTRSKRRPAVVVAQAEHGDVILCQVTSRSYSSAIAVPLADSDFLSGNLSLASFARPDKVFTANPSIILSTIGSLNDGARRRVVSGLVDVLQRGQP